MKYCNLKGQKHHKLEAVAYLINGVWLWKCECGQTVEAAPLHVINGRVKSCGCLNRERVTTHGMTGTRIFNIWQKIKARCTDKNHQAYKNYGGRGVQYRFNSFEEFYAEIGDPPSDDHTVDRKDTNGHYEKGNLKWSTLLEQHNNTRRTRFLTLDGVTKSVMDWARERGLKKTTIYSRLKAGYPIEHVLASSSYRGHGKQPENLTPVYHPEEN